MRIIGIDPGLRCTGFGVIDVEGQQARYVGSGVIRPPVQGSEPERLANIFRGVQELVAHFSPHQAVIERVFVNVNPQSTLSLGQARGSAIAALAQSELPIDEITPLRMKQSIVGSGRATKEQVQFMVQRLLKLSESPGADAADALGCALAWWQTMAHQQALKGAPIHSSRSRVS